MRGGRLYAHDAKGVIPRMSWSPHNLYNLISRSRPFFASQATFKKTGMTMYQQRWKSKKLLRGYHGDWIREKQFTKWYLPIDLPNLKSRFKQDTSAAETSSEEQMPISSLLFRDVERRLDTVVFRCCFARSAREARALVVSGKVQVNGIQTNISGTLLNPGDLISVQPDAIAMLGKELEKQAEMRAASVMSGQEESHSQVSKGENSEGTTAAEIPEEGQDQAASTEEASNEEGIKALAEESTTEAASSESDGSTFEAKSSENSEIATSADTTVSADGSSEGQAAAAKDPEEQTTEPKAKKELAPGVFPFNLPPYAAPFIFVPPYLEVSFTTCSAIYMRHPTITPVKASGKSDRYTPKSASILYKTDIPSPYPAGGDIFPLAWEHYTKTAPRTRSDLRRLKLEATTGTEGIKTARAKDAWKKVRAVRRGYDKIQSSPAPFTVGALDKRRKAKTLISAQSHFIEEKEGISSDARA